MKRIVCQSGDEPSSSSTDAFCLLEYPFYFLLLKHQVFRLSLQYIKQKINDFDDSPIAPSKSKASWRCVYFKTTQILYVLFVL